jgi:hypothetical protein
MRSIMFGTLGPEGTNHEYVTKRYLEFHGIDDAGIRLFGNFDDAVAAMESKEIDYLLQCAVHPDTPRVMGSNFRQLFVVDTFISPSQMLAVLTRADVEHPRSIALVSPATDGYADLSAWEERIPVVSIPYGFDRMMAGECDSALVYLSYHDKYPGDLKVEHIIGSPDDAWIVYGRERVGGDKIVADKTSPVAAQFAAVRKGS